MIKVSDEKLTEGKKGGGGVFNVFSNIKKDPNNRALSTSLTITEDVGRVPGSTVKETRSRLGCSWESGRLTWERGDQESKWEDF